MKPKYLIMAVIALVILGGGYWWWAMRPAPSVQPTNVPPAQQAANTAPAPVTPVAPAPVPPTAPAPIVPTKVVLRENPKLGKYLADDIGRTLYVFAKDLGGQSACVGKCLEVWPAFYLPKVAIGPGLDAPDFSTITRPDGMPQTTYYGWPVYYYSGDAAPGDVNGEGVNKLWFVTKPDYTVIFGNKDNVNYLVDAETSHTLYKFSKDAPDVSNCSGACAQNWPLFKTDKIVAPSFIDAARLGNFVRTDKASQTAFDRWPLYFFVQDKAPGDLKGQGLNGLWSTVDPLAPPAR